MTAALHLVPSAPQDNLPAPEGHPHGLAPDEQEALDRIVAVRAAAIAKTHATHVRVRKIVEEVAAAAGMDPALILSHSRQKPIAELRQLVMWRAHKAGLSYPRIGAALGRDHSTVMKGVRAEEARQKRAGL